VCEDLATFLRARPDDTVQTLCLGGQFLCAAILEKGLGRSRDNHGFEYSVFLHRPLQHRVELGRHVNPSDGFAITSLYDRYSIPGIQKCLHLLGFWKRFVINRDPVRFLDALWLSKDTLATNPRDKIFALLGIYHNRTTFVPDPNYKQSLGSIIAKMSKAIMILNKSLDLICLKGKLSPGKQIEGLLN
jgi:hypothetical protein